MFRVRLAGLEVELVPHVRVLHKRGISVGATTRESTLARRFWIDRNVVALALRYWPTRYLVAASPRLAFRSVRALRRRAADARSPVPSAVASQLWRPPGQPSRDAAARPRPLVRGAVHRRVGSLAPMQGPDRLEQAATSDRRLLTRSSVTVLSRGFAKAAQLIFLVVAARLLDRRGVRDLLLHARPGHRLLVRQRGRRADRGGPGPLGRKGAPRRHRCRRPAGGHRERWAGRTGSARLRGGRLGTGQHAGAGPADRGVRRSSTVCSSSRRRCCGRSGASTSRPSSRLEAPPCS